MIKFDDKSKIVFLISFVFAVVNSVLLTFMILGLTVLGMTVMNIGVDTALMVAFSIFLISSFIYIGFSIKVILNKYSFTERYYRIFFIVSIIYSIPPINPVPYCTINIILDVFMAKGLSKTKKVENQAI